MTGFHDVDQYGPMAGPLYADLRDALLADYTDAHTTMCVQAIATTALAMIENIVDAAQRRHSED